MKKTIQKEVVVCDECGTDEMIFHKCNGCDKAFCFDCNKTKHTGKTFEHGVYCSGSGDVYFCMACLTNLMPRTKEILAAFQTVLFLRNEAIEKHTAFEKRCKDAENKVQEVLEKYQIK